MFEIMSHDNWQEELKRIADKQRVTDYPDNFKSWVTDNADNINAARERGTEPYFIRNNASVIDNILNPDAKPASTSTTALPESANDLIEHVQQFGDLESHYNGELNDREIMRKWDSLNDEQRVEVLERGKYTGMIQSDSSLDFADLYKETSRENMIGVLQDELTNLRDGYDVEDTNHYILKFKGDDNIIQSYDLTKPLTAAQLKKLEFVSANAGLSNYRYWAVDDAAKSRLMSEMGFIEYRDGKIVSSFNGEDYFGNALHQINEKSFDKSLNKVRKTLIRQANEKMYILNFKGTIIHESVGDARSVNFDDDVAKLWKNNIVTHNHPTGKNATGIERVGYSLSLDDVYEAIRCDSRIIVAEAPNYRYAIYRPESGWNIDAEKFKSRYKELYRDIVEKYREQINAHNALIMLQHLVLKQLSKEFNLKYTYDKIS
jgi:hypothetical protein